MKSEIIIQLHKNFEDYAHDIDGEEFWFARDLMGLFGYTKWENFAKVIDKAKQSCHATSHSVADHFPDVRKMITMPKGAEREIGDFMLSRYACYLIAQNGDPQKVEIAFAQTYLAIQASSPAKMLNVSDDPIYQRILKRLHDIGKGFERLPSTYAGKEEEDIRDLMLFSLEPNFEGSATGETFNKSGKTDILLRHEGKNIFIAELKFWRGKKAYLESISQLLSYLTWRDSKSAVVVFVKNKEFSSVLERTKEATLEHENCLGLVIEQEKGLLHYRFHINGDKDSEVKLAVMLFHLPE